MQGWRAICTCTLGMCLFSSWALADGVMRDGQGAISGGRGGTNIAFSDNGAILLDNPAGMTNIAGNGMLDCSLDSVVAAVDYYDPENSVSNDVAAYPLGYFSWMQKTAGGTFAYGLGVFTPAGFGARYDMINTGVDPARVNYEYMSFGALVRVLPAAAVQVTDRLSIGGTLGVAASHAEIEGPFVIQSGPFATTPTLLDMQATGAALSWSLGVQYQLTDRTTVGAAYNSRNKFDLDGTAAVTIAGMGSSRYDVAADLTWPQTFGAGLQHQVCPCRRLGLDVIWFDWSQAFDRLDIAMSNPGTAGFPAQVSDSFPLNWRDSVSVRVGYEQMFPRAYIGRIGYTYHRNPIPNGTMTPYIPGTLEHAFSVGLGKQWCDHSFNIAYSYSFGRDEEVGVSDLVGGDFSNSRVEASAHWLMLNFTRIW